MARDEIYDLDSAFVDRATALGDRCFGFVEGDVLTSYGWYSRRPTEAGHGLVLRFDPAYVYMYKGFTHPKHRGQRLHAIGMAAALEEYTREGAKGARATSTRRTSRRSSRASAWGTAPSGASRSEAEWSGDDARDAGLRPVRISRGRRELGP